MGSEKPQSFGENSHFHSARKDDASNQPADPREPHPNDTVLQIKDSEAIVKEIKADDAVVLRLEFMSDRESRFNTIMLRCMVVAAIVLIILQAIWLSQDIRTSNIQSHKVILLDFIVTVVMLVAMLGYGAFYLYDLIIAKRSGKNFHKRRARLCTLTTVDLVVGLLLMVFYIIPNLFVLWVEPCGWFLELPRVCLLIRDILFATLFTNQLLHGMTILPLALFKRMRNKMISMASCSRKGATTDTDTTTTTTTATAHGNNHDDDEYIHDEHSKKALNDDIIHTNTTVTKPKIYVGIDLPWYYYCAVFFFFWLPFAGLEIAYRVSLAMEQGGYCSSPYDTECFPFADPSVACTQWNWICDISYQTRSISIAASVWGIFIALVYLVAVLLAKQTLKTLPYNRYRIAHVQLGLQMPPRIFVLLLYIIVSIFRSAVTSNDCDASIAGQLLFGVLQVPIAVLVCTTCYVNSPIVPGDSELKFHAWLQDYAWIEKDVPSKLAARPFTGEPCFCFETALKANYFSMLIYYIDEIESEQFTKEIAMGLYGLDEFRVFWHKKHDAKCFVAWSRSNGTVVLSFRGTASLANVKADLKIWRDVHPPKESGGIFHSQPLIHSGFMETWEKSGLKDEVLDVLKDLFSKNPTDDPTRPWRVVVTGHSLGGAMAQLAAFDIQTIASQYTQAKQIDLSCITYGCPRTGNHAFARRFRDNVKDAWDIIHTSDIVARSGKFVFLYKRAGIPVIISLIGDLIVRPSYAESAALRGYNHSIKHHLLTTYIVSLMEVIKQQHRGMKKSTVSGSRALEKLLNEPRVEKLIEVYEEQWSLADKHETLLQNTMNTVGQVVKLGSDYVHLAEGRIVGVGGVVKQVVVSPAGDAIMQHVVSPAGEIVHRVVSPAGEIVHKVVSPAEDMIRNARGVVMDSKFVGVGEDAAKLAGGMFKKNVLNPSEDVAKKAHGVVMDKVVNPGEDVAKKAHGVVMDRVVNPAEKAVKAAADITGGDKIIQAVIDIKDQAIESMESGMADRNVYSGKRKESD